jgi:hypothetical protein
MSRSRLSAAAMLRRRAYRLAWAAEAIGDYEPYRDTRAERNRLREQAGRADQRASVLEEAAGYRPRRRCR